MQHIQSDQTHTLRVIFFVQPNKFGPVLLHDRTTGVGRDDDNGFGLVKLTETPPQKEAVLEFEIRNLRPNRGGIDSVGRGR